MNGLPVDLAPPLHLMEPGGASPWLLLLPLLLALAVLYWWRRRRKAPVPPAAPRQPPPPSRPPGLAGEIGALHEHYRKKGNFRRGCHELARLLRQHFTATRTLTAREIATAMGDAGIAQIFELLAELQFSREQPRRSDFSGICELAQETVRGGGSQK